MLSAMGLIMRLHTVLVTSGEVNTVPFWLVSVLQSLWRRQQVPKPPAQLPAGCPPRVLHSELV